MLPHFTVTHLTFPHLILSHIVSYYVTLCHAVYCHGMSFISMYCTVCVCILFQFLLFLYFTWFFLFLFLLESPEHDQFQSNQIGSISVSVCPSSQHCTVYLCPYCLFVILFLFFVFFICSHQASIKIKNLLKFLIKKIFSNFFWLFSPQFFFISCFLTNWPGVNGSKEKKWNNDCGKNEYLLNTGLTSRLQYYCDLILHNTILYNELQKNKTKYSTVQYI